MESDASCEVAVIGGGISGALAAYFLTRAGVETVMIDRRRVGHGSTSASTGMLQYEIDTPLIELMKKIGQDRAITAYQASLDALLAFEPLVAELGDSCGLAARPSVYLAAEKADLKDISEESEARRAMGIEVEYLDRVKLRRVFNLPGHGALVSTRAFEVDPFRLTMRLIGRAIEGGLRVFDETEIASLQSRAEGVALCTTSGFHLTAKKVVIATGYETIVHLPPGLSRVRSTYAVASQPIASFEDWPGRCMIWESARPYLYLRTTQDSRVIVGGADEEIVEANRRDALIEAKARYLLDRFSKLFPRIEIEADCAWAGAFAETPDGLPYIGELPQFPHCYFALGYGGNGITFSLLAAGIILDLFLGRENSLAGLFGFSR